MKAPAWIAIAAAALVLVGAADGAAPKVKLTVAISGLQSTYGVEWDLLSAAAFLLMLMPLVIFFALQRYFVQGLLAGSVK